MLQPKTETQFAVARDGAIISDGFTNVATAKQQLAHVSDTMRSVGLEPDVEIVTVEVKTTLGKPKAWKDPSLVDEDTVAGADLDAAKVAVEKTAAKPAAPAATAPAE